MDSPSNSRFIDGISEYLYNLDSKNPYRYPTVHVPCYLNGGLLVETAIKVIVCERCEGEEIGYDIVIAIV